MSGHGPTAPRRTRLLGGTLWAAAFAAVGLALLLGGSERESLQPGNNDPVNLHVTHPGGPGVGTPIDLSSYQAAAATLIADDVRLEWPGAGALGEHVLTNATVAFHAPSKSVTLSGSMVVDGVTMDGMLILDWDGSEPMPVISLGVKGTVDMTMFNADWSLEGGAFDLAGFAAIATGEQDLTAIPAAAAFYGDRETLGEQLVVEGSMSLAGLLPGIGAGAGLQVDLAGELDVDIASLLSTAEAEPADPGAVHLEGTIAASNLSIPSLPGLTATTFTLQLDLAGDEGAAEEDFAVFASGEVTIDDDAVASAPVTFDVTFQRDGAATIFTGGLKEGTTWPDPFGVSGLEVSAARLGIDAPGGGATPTLSITVEGSAGGVGFSAAISANDELTVQMTVDPVSIEQMVGLFGAMGFDVGSLSSMDDELAAIVIGPTALRLETVEGQVTGALSTGITFRGKTATFLLAGGTGPNGGLLAAVQLPSFTIKDLWPTAPPTVSNITLPDGGFVLSSDDVTKDTFEAGDIEDDFLSEMYCGATTAPADCDYTVPTGLSLAAQITLDPGIREALAVLGPLANSPIRVEGTLPVFGGSDFNISIILPDIVPTPGSATSEWLVRAELRVDMVLSVGNVEVKLTGSMDTKLPDETELDGFDEVTFTVDAAIQIGTKGIGITIGAEIGSWPTPFGIDWIDLNGFRLEVIIKVAPQPGVQVGLAASATLKSACEAFGGSGCPPPSTFEASFAIGVAAGAPVQVDFGFRMFADAIYLKDVAAIAKEMGATGIDPSSMPNASLRNVELAFGSIDAPSLCLRKGLVIAADVYLDDPMASGGPGAEPARTLCTDTSISPAEGIASCQAHPECFAHLRLAVNDDGITGAAALGTITMGPISVSNASVALTLTPAEQSFKIAGTVSIEGFASASGSLGITNTGIEFSLTVGDNNGSGNLFTIEGSAGLNIDDPGFYFNLKIFARLPGLNSAIAGAQDVVNFLSQVFTGEPLATTYALRCVEVNVALASGASDPISGFVNAKVHFSAIATATGYEDARMWEIGWDFDASLATNVSGLVTSLSGATALDVTGCGYDPTPTRFNINGGTGLATEVSAIKGTTVNFDARWTSTDFAMYVVKLDLGDGQPARVSTPALYTSGQTIQLTASTVYPFIANGYERRSAVATVHLGSVNGPVVGSMTLPILLSDNNVTGYSLTQPPAVNEGGTVTVTATWTDPVPIVGADNLTSRYTWNILGLNPTSGTSQQIFTPGPLSGYPVGSQRTHTFNLPIPNPCACGVSIVHEVLSNGIFVRAGNTIVVPVNYAKPVVTNVTIDGSSADPAVAGPSSLATVTFTDTPSISGGYEVWVNNLPLPTTTLAPGSLRVPLSSVYVDGQQVPLLFQVRSLNDGNWVRSDPFRQDAVFRPLNSSPSFAGIVSLLPGQSFPWVVRGTTLTPLTSDDSPNPFGSTDCGAIWFAYTAQSNVTVRVATDGSYTAAARAGGVYTQELALQVFDTSASNSVVAQILPDGNPGITNYPQVLSFSAITGHTYRIAVAASDMPVGCAQDLSRSGPVTLTFTPIDPPPMQDSVQGGFEQLDGINQFFAMESLFPPLNTNTDTTLDGATSSTFDEIALHAAGFEQCFDDPLDQTVWYLLGNGVGVEEPWAGQHIDIATLANGDVQIAVFKARVFDVGVPSELIGCSEDGPTSSFLRDMPAPPVVSFVAEELPLGWTYWVMFDTNGMQDADIEPFIAGYASTILNPIPVSLGDSVQVDSTMSSSEVGFDDLTCTGSKVLAHNTWFSYTATSADAVDIGLPLGNLDLAIAVFPATKDVSSSRAIGCEDELGSSPETLRLNPTAGQEYLIVVASEDGEVGTVQLDITRPGDDSVNEERIGFPARVHANNTGATGEGKTSSCANPETGSLWWGIDLPAGVTDLDLDIDTVGSPIDTRLVVSTAGGEVGCNDDVVPGTLWSQVRVDDAVDFENGFADLYVRVDGYNNAQGDISLNVTTRGDDIHNAIGLGNAVPASATNTNTYATVEADEQRGSCHYQADAPGQTVWYRWTSPASFYYAVQATGFDTELTIYTVDGNGQPGEMVGCGEDELPGLEARARWAAPAGTTYLIQVDGWQNTVGTFTLGITQDGVIDPDGDGVGDDLDNCPTVANAGQQDGNGNGVGDACDPEPAFISLTPARLADTRSAGVTIDGQYQAAGKVTGGTAYTVQVTGRGNVPVGAKAAVLNVTVLQSTATGFATVYPCSPVRPNASSINFTSGSIDPNEVVAKLSATGTVCVYVSQSAQVIIDVVGYARTESPYQPLDPGRFADTRSAGATIDDQFEAGGIRASGSTYEVQIAGRGLVPNGAAAAVINLTVVGSTANGFGTVYPCTPTRPTASSVNWTTGLVRPNELVVKLSDTGTVCIYVSAPTHLILDVVGYLPPSDGYTPLTPARLTDTRPGQSTIDGFYTGDGPQNGGSTYEVQVAGRGGVPLGATTAVLNVSVIAQANGYATVYPCGTLPNSSSLNYQNGNVRPNEVVAKLSPEGRVCVFVSGKTNLIVDVVGYL